MLIKKESSNKTLILDAVANERAAFERERVELLHLAATDNEAKRSKLLIKEGSVKLVELRHFFL